MECLKAVAYAGAYYFRRLEEARSSSDGLGFGGIPPLDWWFSNILAEAYSVGDANLRFMVVTLRALMLILRSEAFKSSSSSFKSVQARSKHWESVAAEFSYQTSSSIPSSPFAAASVINCITRAYYSRIDFLSAYGSCQRRLDSF